MTSTMNGARASFITRAQKAELHCHLDGILDPAMLRALGSDDPACEEQARRLAGVFPVRSVEQWAGGYHQVATEFLSPLELRLPLVALAQVARWQAQQVRYAELFVSSMLGAISDVGALTDWFRALGGVVV
ncbi:MAG TPA: hypothetical protein VGI10_24645 [Polyangiaceae bacterium]